MVVLPKNNIDMVELMRCIETGSIEGVVLFNIKLLEKRRGGSILKIEMLEFDIMKTITSTYIHFSVILNSVISSFRGRHRICAEERNMFTFIRFSLRMDPRDIET